MFLLLASLFAQTASAQIPQTQLQIIFEGAPAQITPQFSVKVQEQEEPPKKRSLKTPLPQGVKPKISEPGPKIGFSAGFLAGEFIPMLVMQTPYVGKPIGWLLYAIFFPAALIAGGIGFLIGQFL